MNKATPSETNELVDIRKALTDWQTHVDTATSITKTERAAMNPHLGVLWDAAAGNPDIQAEIIKVAKKADALVEQNTALAFQVAAIGSIAHNAVEQAEAEAEARNQLEDAIDAGDEQHPHLRDFAATIREDAAEEYREWMEDEAWPEAMAEAYEEIRGEMVERVRRLTGCGLSAAHKFLAVTMGRRVHFTPLQAEMFAAFLMTFEVSVDGQLEAQEARSGS